MDTLTLPNVVAYSAQVIVLVALGTVLARVLRIDAAGVRYGYWRVIFALCLLLPMLQGREVPVASESGSGTVSTTIAVSEAPAHASSSLPFDWTDYVFPVIASGAVIRLLWLAVSYARLRRLRRAGELTPDFETRSELRTVIGTDCEMRYVPGLRQPVTFGWVRPVILLPPDLAERGDDIQRAVLSHELFHVKRRDWGWLLIEEIFCALLWFNPAIWWLVSRLQLARELVVDELAVLATGRRRAYVEALMTFADERSPAPVAAFGTRAHLFNRIVLLSKEAGMSSRRLVCTCAVVAAALGAGLWHTVAAFPLTAAPQSIRQMAPGPFERQAKPITPENPIPRRTNYEPPAYPMEARAAGARGSVTLMITLDELGRVVEARRVHISVTSRNPAASIRFTATNYEDEKRLSINSSKDPAAASTLLAVVSAMDDAAVRAVSQWRYEPPHQGPISFPVVISFSESQDGVRAERLIEVAPEGLAHPDGAVRVGGNIKTPTKIRDVRPVYPPAARDAKVSGMVILEIWISEDGTVEDAKVLRSIPVLDQAAIDAVMQWQFVPTSLNGKPVPVIMTVTVNFTIQNGFQRGRGAGATVAGQRRMPEVLKEVKPSYTPEALEARVQGIVEMEVTVGTDGTVNDARVIRSVPLLDESALEAVRQWRFTPIPQPVAVNIEMTFALPRGR